MPAVHEGALVLGSVEVQGLLDDVVRGGVVGYRVYPGVRPGRYGSGVGDIPGQTCSSVPRHEKSTTMINWVGISSLT